MAGAQKDECAGIYPAISASFWNVRSLKHELGQGSAASASAYRAFAWGRPIRTELDCAALGCIRLVSKFSGLPHHHRQSGHSIPTPAIPAFIGVLNRTHIDPQPHPPAPHCPPAKRHPRAICPPAAALQHVALYAQESQTRYLPRVSAAPKHPCTPFDAPHRRSEELGSSGAPVCCPRVRLCIGLVGGDLCLHRVSLRPTASTHPWCARRNDVLFRSPRSAHRLSLSQGDGIGTSVEPSLP